VQLELGAGILGGVFCCKHMGNIIYRVGFLLPFVFLFGWLQQEDHSMAASGLGCGTEQCKLQRGKSSTELSSFSYCVYIAHGLFIASLGADVEAVQ
jgi:hypothetical protein